MKKSLLLLILVVCKSLNLFAQCNPDISTGLIAKWDFNGNSNDASGNGNNGTVVGATLTTDRCGNFNSAYSFYGTNQYINVPDKSSLRLNNTDFTIAAWVFKYDTTKNTNYTIIAKRIEDNQTGYHFYIGGSNVGADTGKVGFIVSGDTDPKGTSDSIIQKKKWEHVTVVYTLADSTLKFYINGVLSGITHSIPSPSATAASLLRIGNDTWVPGPYGLNGKLDDLRMYNRALNFCDIDSLVKVPCNGLSCNDISTGIIASWDFSGNANDLSGNGHNGTIHEAILTTDRCNNPSSAYLFNRLGSTYIEVPNSSALSISKTDFTISLWVYEPDSLIRGGNAIVKRNGTSLTNGYFMGTNTSTHKINFTIAGGSTGAYNLYSNSAIDSLKWTHIAITYSYPSRRMKMYINGILDKDTSNVPSPTATSANFLIGRDFVNQSSPRFNGKIDDVRMYNLELDSCGIKTLFNQSCNALPLTLTSFYASLQNNKVTLDWQTAQEINTSYFIVEKSNTGRSFMPVVQIASFGSNSKANNYTATDNNPFTGKNWYRLKMVDKDGKFTYSKTVPVEFNSKDFISINPNPVTDKLNLKIQNLYSGKVILRINNVNGKNIAIKECTIAPGTNNISFSVQSFAKGAYFLEVIQNNKSQVLKWIKD